MQIWSRYGRNFDSTRPAYSTVLWGEEKARFIKLKVTTASREGIGLSGWGARIIKLKNTTAIKLKSRLLEAGGDEVCQVVIDSGLVGSTDFRKQKMLKGHLPSVVYHQVYKYTKEIYQRGYGATWRDGTRCEGSTGVSRSQEAVSYERGAHVAACNY